MPFLAHLEILRWHIIRSVSAIVIAAVMLFLNKSFLFDKVVFAPKKPDFISYRLLCKLSEFLHGLMPTVTGKDTLCIGQNLPPLQNISMSGQFMTHITASVIGGFVLAFPYVMWELWRFIKPGLHPTERKYTKGFVLITSLLFFIGVLFGYYVIAPLSIDFLLTYNISSEVINNPTLGTYISTVTTVVLACGLIFELPVLVYFLSKMGILSAAFMKKYRRHAIVVALVISAIITPPDVFSQILVAIPIMFLYEISIFIARKVAPSS
ncbi:MAG: twin-arginine translocase subunit TatC [Bacteroidetes bacterium]|nr:MAG: twin-arginine translocase subunit TatC [Bacteroidota bacterium]